MNEAPFASLTGREKADKAVQMRADGLSSEVIAAFLGWTRADTVEVMISKAKKWDHYANIQKQRWIDRKANLPTRPMHTAWLAEHDEKLLELWPTHTATELAPIMSVLLGRTVGRGAITGRVARLGLPPKDRWFRRPTNVKRPGTKG